MKLYLFLVGVLLIVAVSEACFGGQSDATVGDDGSGSGEKKSETSGGKSDENKQTDDDDEEVGPACKSRKIKDIIESTATDDPTASSTAIQAKLQEEFGGNAISVCSTADFAWTIWYGRRKQCKATKNKVTCLAYLD